MSTARRDLTLADAARCCWPPARPFNRAGVLVPADVHTAETVGRIGRGTRRERFVLALRANSPRAPQWVGMPSISATVHATAFDETESAIDLAELPWPEPEPWLRACAGEPVGRSIGADQPGGRPLRLADGLLYLERYWQQEEPVRVQLAAPLRAPARRTIDRSRLSRPCTGCSDRKARRRRSRPPAAGGGRQRPRLGHVLAGGPGTGKTTTVARLLALLRDQPGPPLRDRPGRADRQGRGPAGGGRPSRHRASSDETDRDRLGDLSASTLHRLLGWLPASRGRFRHDASNQLPHDVVVVDEMSMVSLTMMARLLEAVRPSARLVLVGDPDQLSSVEAGAVLADIARAPGIRRTRRWAAAWSQLGRWCRRRGPADARRRAADRTPGGSAGRSMRWPRRSGRPTPTPPWPCCAPGADDVEFADVDLEAGDEHSRCWSWRTSPARYAGRRRDAGGRRSGRHSRRRSPRSTGIGCCAPTARGPYGVARWSLRGRALAGGRHAGLRRGRRVVPRPPAARHRERLRAWASTTATPG